MLTVAEYIRDTRIILQDTLVGAYRYSDDELVLGLDMAIREARRLRPDMFRYNKLPKYTGEPVTTEVEVDEAYASAIVYYMAGNAQIRDAEENQDARATVFLNKFVAQLTTFPA